MGVGVSLLLKGVGDAAQESRAALERCACPVERDVPLDGDPYAPRYADEARIVAECLHCVPGYYPVAASLAR